MNRMIIFIYIGMLLGCSGCGLANGIVKDFSGYGEQLTAKVQPKEYDSYDTSVQVGASDQKNTSAQNNSSTSASSPEYSDEIGDAPEGKFKNKFDVAVIIGNRDYKKTSTVDFAVNDASKVKEFAVNTLGIPVGNIIYIENATLTDFTEVFGQQTGEGGGKLLNFIKPNVSNVFVYYVGHGAPDIKSPKPEAYFVPVDADPQYISNSGYKVQALYDNLSRLPVKKMTVVLDSCFSGNSPKGILFKGISGLLVVGKTNKIAAKNSILLTSTSENQVSSWYDEKKHSLFTYYFLKGLQGEADNNKDNNISVAEMKNYLDEKVSYMSRRLTGNDQQPTVNGKDNQVIAELK
ncbi:MAG: caspase family protein [Desulfuromonadaceae bacterium]|nr:caspase family protein [Desulfuromonadaceae bacterium]MDD2855683.1 caspase family protein [Desulfuromonadaceae bacterium]